MACVCAGPCEKLGVEPSSGAGGATPSRRSNSVKSAPPPEPGSAALPNISSITDQSVAGSVGTDSDPLCACAEGDLLCRAWKLPALSARLRRHLSGPKARGSPVVASVQAWQESNHRHGKTQVAALASL